MTIIVPPDLENSINAAVRSGHFASLDAAMTEAARLLLQQLEQRQAPEPPPTAESLARKPIWEVAEELAASIPPEEWDKLPVDGAAQHDHYIYGTPKRPVTP